jgi:hypothetical protein
MAAGIAHWPSVSHRVDLPTPVSTWRVPTLAHCSWGLIARTFEDRVAIRLELSRPKALELLLVVGVDAIDGDIGVLLEFADEDSAYSFLRYCVTQRIQAYLYLDGMMISSPGGVEFYLRMMSTAPEEIRPKKRTPGEELYIRSVLKTWELEQQWRRSHLR